MKKIIAKLLSTSLALTLVVASAHTAAQPSIKTKEIKTKAPSITENVKEEKAETNGVNILTAIEEKFEEIVTVNTEDKTVPVVTAEKAEEIAVVTEEKVVPAETENVEIALPVIEEEKEIGIARLVAPEAEAAKAETIAVPEAEAVAAPEEIAVPEAVTEEKAIEWNISASENDNVVMKFTAAQNEGVVANRTTGVVDIYGTGEMEEAVYRHFLSAEKYVDAVKAIFFDGYGVEVEVVYPEGLTDVLEIDSMSHVFALEDGENVVAGEELYATDEMLENLNPELFLEFSPTEIRIHEGITSISYVAFVFCADLETVVLPKSIETIGEYAFEYCNSLKTIIMPKGTEIELGAFCYCYDLVTIKEVEDGYYEATQDNVTGYSAEAAEDYGTDWAYEDVLALIYCY